MSEAAEGLDTCNISILAGFRGIKGGGPLVIAVSFEDDLENMLDFLIEAPAKLLRRLGEGGLAISSNVVSITGCLCRISGGGGGKGSSGMAVSNSKPGGGGGKSGEGTLRLGFLGGLSGTQPSCISGGTG